MSLVPRATPEDTLFTAQRLQASLSVRSLFAGRPVFSGIEIIAARLTAHKTANRDNFSFLLSKKDAAATAAQRDTSLGTNYGLLLNRVLEAGFDNVPAQANFQDFLVSYDGTRHIARLQMPRLTIEDGDIRGQLTANVDSIVNKLGISGHVEPGDYELDVQLFGLDGSVQVPYVSRRFGALVSFDTVRAVLSSKDFDADDTTPAASCTCAARWRPTGSASTTPKYRIPRWKSTGAGSTSWLRWAGAR